MNFTGWHWDAWVVFGFVGQACFTARFVVQWIASERQKKSVIPILFWYFSLLGGAVLTVYAFHRKDPVFLLGQSFGLIVYFRNLALIRKSGALARGVTEGLHDEGNTRVP